MNEDEDHNGLNGKDLWAGPPVPNDINESRLCISPEISSPTPSLSRSASSSPIPGKLFLWKTSLFWVSSTVDFPLAFLLLDYLRYPAVSMPHPLSRCSLIGLSHPIAFRFLYRAKQLLPWWRLSINRSDTPVLLRAASTTSKAGQLHHSLPSPFCISSSVTRILFLLVFFFCIYLDCSFSSFLFFSILAFADVCLQSGRHRWWWKTINMHSRISVSASSETN